MRIGFSATRVHNAPQAMTRPVAAADTVRFGGREEINNVAVRLNEQFKAAGLPDTAAVFGSTTAGWAVFIGHDTPEQRDRMRGILTRQPDWAPASAYRSEWLKPGEETAGQIAGLNVVLMDFNQSGF